MGAQQQTRRCRFADVGKAEYIGRSIAARPALIGGERMRAVPRCQRT